TQFVERDEITDVNRRQPLGQQRLVARGQRPLRKVTRESRVVMTLEALERVMKQRRVRARAQTFSQLAQRPCAFRANQHEVRRGYESEWCVPFSVHGRPRSSRESNSCTSAGERTK